MITCTHHPFFINSDHTDSPSSLQLCNSSPGQKNGVSKLRNGVPGQMDTSVKSGSKVVVTWT